MSDRFGLGAASQRRAACAELGGIHRFETGMFLRKKFLKAVRMDPGDGFEPLTVSQIEVADRRFWEMVDEELEENGLGVSPPLTRRGLWIMQ